MKCHSHFFFSPGNVFITYSLDTSSEMVPFVDFLTKQGFRPAVSNFILSRKRQRNALKTNNFLLTSVNVICQIDILDSPVRRMDINKWKDTYLKDVGGDHDENLILWIF